MAGRLVDRVAIITGGGRGIGRATVERFAAEGAKVLIATRTQSAGEEAAAAVRRAGGTAEVLAIDIGDADAPQRAIDAAVERWARLDIIVHNAAFVPYGPMSEMADETFMRAFDTNVAAGFRFLKHGIDHLAASGSGRLILTSSIAARGPVPAGLAAYGMSKAAIEGFVRGAAVELAPRRITVNAVAPGATLTPSMEHGMSPEAIEGLRRTMPFGRIGSSDDIAGAMLYLASDDGAYVSGHVLVVDGAQSLSRELALDQAGSEV